MPRFVMAGIALVTVVVGACCYIDSGRGYSWSSPDTYTPNQFPSYLPLALPQRDLSSPRNHEAVFSNPTSWDTAATNPIPFFTPLGLQLESRMSPSRGSK
mmetsp:Transcript_14012/g.22789  ORF Transcript_14012/g.22789 Transcript_14012/m.22789 type:complete len:100 (+) Transcript_14012:128-427(+)